MENTKIENYVDFIKDFAIDELNDRLGNNFYSCDLAHELTESINIDGSYTYSTYLAKQYIKEWFDEAGEIYQYQIDNYGQALYNPFEEPEKFHVCMIIEGVSALLNSCEFIQENWNDEIELTEENVNTIIEQINEINEILIF